MINTLLITGGAGYVGSVVARQAHLNGYEVIILDRKPKETISYLPFAHYIQGDVGDAHLLHTIFSSWKIDAVIHTAASIEVGRSVVAPDEFYHNNVTNSLTLLNAMRMYGVNKIIFSSSCAVYGNPDVVPIPEHQTQNPVSPYGRTKQIFEAILADYAHAYGLRSVSLRYFNVAGAWPEYNLGERHDPETHIIPLIMKAAQQKKHFTIFGDDYSTSDGTCVRDFIHVRDIAQAHMKALEYLTSNRSPLSVNIGSGVGISVLELVAYIESHCKTSIVTSSQRRREGDPSHLVALCNESCDKLSWQPQHSSLHEIIESAWEFERMKLKMHSNDQNKIYWSTQCFF